MMESEHVLPIELRLIMGSLLVIYAIYAMFKMFSIWDDILDTHRTKK